MTEPSKSQALRQMGLLLLWGLAEIAVTFFNRRHPVPSVMLLEFVSLPALGLWLTIKQSTPTGEGFC